MATTDSTHDKCLIIRLSALGDVAMTLPVIYSVCQQNPQTEFFMLTRGFFKKIFINAPANLTIITPDFKGEHKGTAGLIRLVSMLRKYHFSHVADLHNNLRSWAIDAAMRMQGAEVRMVDKDRRHRCHNNKHKVRQMSYIERYITVFRELGYQLTPTFTSIFEGCKPESAEIKHPAVGIAPFARYANKAYPLEYVAEVVKRLTDSDVNVYLYGGRGAEAEALEALANTNQRCFNMAGKGDISHELATIANLDLMVSMDSANQHLASIVGTRVLTIWGSTSPICGFMGYNQSEDDALIASLPCQPCTTAGGEHCRLGNIECMHRLTPEMVSTQILERLQERR